MAGKAHRPPSEEGGRVTSDRSAGVDGFKLPDGSLCRTPVHAFVDGLNLYNGLVAKDYRRFLWLDIGALLGRFARPHQDLASVTYFTARVRGPQDRSARQAAFLDALRSTGVELVFGKAERRSTKCPECGKNWMRTAEKMTDVAIGCRLLLAAQRDPKAELWLVSGDADMVPAVTMAREEYGSRVVVIAPRGRHSDELNQAADAALHIRTAWLRDCQFTTRVEVCPGHFVNRPESWGAAK